MSTNNFDSRKISIYDLLNSQNTYEVPIHQRDYSWGKDEIEALWSDVICAIKEKDYFFGSMIFQDSASEKVKIILDGQQRLATVVIFLAVIRDCFYKLHDLDSAQDIQKHFIIDKFLKKEVRKITLNLRNKDFFYYCIQKFPTDGDKQEIKDYEKKNGTTKTNKLIRNAYNTLNDNVEKEIKGKSKAESINFLTELSTALTDKFVIIMITVSTEEEAYMIFETINDRGLELSVADLFKNYLIRIAAKSEKKDVVRDWQDITVLLDDKIRAFLRHYWSSKIQQITERRLFSMLKQHIETKNKRVGSFVKHLKEEAIVYSALLNPELDYWQDNETVKLLEDFNALNIKQCLIILMAAKDKLTNKNFKKIVSLVINFAFRYTTICGLHNNILESKYSDIAKKIRKGTIKTEAEVKAVLMSIYPNDKKFLAAFNVKEIKNSSIARYILRKIDLIVSKSQEKLDYSSLTLEHVLPKSPDLAWKKYLKKQKVDEKEIKSLIVRIGNLTLLDFEVNRIAANKLYALKRKEYYLKSKIKLNEYFKNVKDWNKEEIEKRQTSLGQTAAKVWCM